MSNTDFDIPVVVTASGPVPTPPASLLAQLIANVTATNPGYTASLPGSLIEDVSSTDVGALVICDTARVELINSISPFAANDFMLSQLGQVYIGPGAAPGVPTNTSVYVIFTAVNSNSNPLPGQLLAVGFTVSDGTYQYVVQDGGVTDSNGLSSELFCLATVAGTWAVPSNTVTGLVTSEPPNVTLTVTNPEPGISGAAAETSEQWRARVLQAGQAIAVGTQTLLKTLLGTVAGVQQRLISTFQQEAGGWEIIVGGGDPYLVAGAIMASGVDVSTLVGSVLAVTAITKANPGVVTTDLNHGFTSGQTGVVINEIVGMVQLNGVSLTITVLSEKTFSVGLDTTGYSTYVSGGVVTPNFRNQSVNLFDYPDTYTVQFVVPPQQTVTMTVNWQTTLPNFTAAATVAQLAQPAIATYVNSVSGGQPLNILQLQDAFIVAVSTVLPESEISSLAYTISINGVVTAPSSGTNLVYGDPESYFEATSSGIVVTQR